MRTNEPARCCSQAGSDQGAGHCIQLCLGGKHTAGKHTSIAAEPEGNPHPPASPPAAACPGTTTLPCQQGPACPADARRARTLRPASTSGSSSSSSRLRSGSAQPSQITATTVMAPHRCCASGEAAACFANASTWGGGGKRGIQGEVGVSRVRRVAVLLLLLRIWRLPALRSLCLWRGGQDGGGPTHMESRMIQAGRQSAHWRAHAGRVPDAAPARSTVRHKC